MSSNTQPRVTWRDYQVSGSEAVPVNRLLGKNGAKLLRETLNNPRQMQGGDLVALVDWQKAPTENDCYQTTADDITLTLRLGGSVAHLSYSYQNRVYDGRGPVPSGLSQAQIQSMHRKVNQLLAVTMAQQISNKVEQYVKMRLPAQQVRQEQRIAPTMANHLTLRVSAYFG
jgi:hypothetical protein